MALTQERWNEKKGILLKFGSFFYVGWVERTLHPPFFFNGTVGFHFVPFEVKVFSLKKL
jgi:hypothetical protein